jgi:diadenosine tetraphosphate (Ap4A) HIT family hydrolase
MENTVSCDICELIADGTGNLYTGTKWVVSLARDQGYLGRTYVTLKAHKGALRELTADEWSEYGRIVSLLERAGRAAFGADLFNWSCLINLAYASDAPEPHIHWHVRPRYSQPVTIGETTFEDPAFGSHYDRDQRVFIEEPLLGVIRERYKAQIDLLSKP